MCVNSVNSRGHRSVNLNRRAHCGRYCNGLYVLTFRGSRLQPVDGGENVLTLSTSLCLSNDALPTMECRLPALSTLNSIFPALISVIAFATSMVTVPLFGFGINPFGPRTLPNFRRPPWNQVSKRLHLYQPNLLAAS